MIPSLAQQHLETILIKLGAYNHELSLQLLRTLLWHTTPQGKLHIDTLFGDLTDNLNCYFSV